MTKGQSVGGLFIDTGLDLTGIERDLQKARQFVERTNGVKLNIDNRAAKTAIEQVKADLAALKGMSERDAQARAQAAKLLGSAYKDQAASIRTVSAAQAQALAVTKALSAQVVLSARLSAQADREAAAAVRALVTARKEAASLAGRASSAGDLARSKTALEGLLRTMGKLQTIGAIKLKFDMTSANAELARLQGRSVLLKVSFSNFDTIKNDLTTPKGLLGGIGANMQYRVTVNTTALNAVYTNINTQITALQSLISQLRALGAGGGGGGGGAGRGGISAANRTLLAELEALNNSWKRGDIGAAAFGTQLTALQGRLRTASAGAAAGTADFRALDAGLTRLTGSLRSINTDAFQKLRTDAGAMRAAFDAATAGFRRNSTEFRAASAVYATEGARITAELQGMARAGNLTTTQLGQVNREIQRLAREQNTIRGGINAGGLSGNIVNSFGMLPGQLGMMASQGGAAINAITGIAAAAGPAGLAVGGLALAVGGAALAAGKAVNEYAKFEKGLAQVATLTDKTTAQLGDTGRAVLKISGEVGATYTDLNAGLYDVLGAGVKGTEDMTASLQLLKQSAQLAKAGATDTKTATDVLTSVMNAYGLEATDATMVSDKLFKSVQDGKMSFAQLAQSLGMVLPTAKMAGLSLDEVLGSVAALTAQGVKPSSAIEYLRSALTNIIKPSMQAKETAADLGIQFDAQGLKAKGLTGFLRDVIEKTDGNSEAMARLFGDIGALTAVTGLANGDFERLTQTLEGQANAAGKTAEAYEKVAITIDSKSESIAAKWKSLWVNVGESFAPIKLSILSGIDDMLNDLNTLLDKFNQAKREASGANKTDLQKELDAKTQALTRERSTLASAQSTADAQKRVTGSVSEPFQARLDAQKAKVGALESQVAALALQVRAESQQNGTFVGPVQNGTPGLALTAEGADALGAKVVQAGAGKLGVISADSIVNYCAQWVRLVLGKATPEVSSKINELFQTDSNADGSTDATDAARNLLKGGFAQRYNPKDLKEGDVLFYTENGQNHTGIYIGNGMVRGNNRVTYAANGGKFDNYGNPTSPGVNPVGNVAINKLGTPNWIVRPGDMLTALGAKAPATATPTAGGGSGANATSKSFDSYMIEARRILGQIEKFSPQGNAPDGQKWAKATAQLKAFGDQNDTTAQALAYVQLETKKADKTFDRLKGQMDITGSLQDLGRPSAEISKNLKSISTDALTAAQAEKKRNGETAKYRALLDLAGDAAKRLKGIEDKKPELTPVQREQQVLAQQRAAEKMVADMRRAGTGRLSDIIKGGVQKEGDLDRVKGAEAELKRRADLDTEAGKQARKALEDNAALIGKLAEETAKAAVIRDKEQRALRAKYAAERRNLDVQEASATLTRTQELNRQELADFKGTAAQKVTLLKRQAKDEFNATEQAERAKRDKAVRDAENDVTNPNKQRNIDGANQAYKDAVSKAQNIQTAAGTQATEDQSKAIQTARDGYSKLAQTMREKIAAGKVELSDLTEYRVGMDQAAAAAEKSGVAQTKYVKGARASAEALYQAGIDAQIAAGMFADLDDGQSRAAEAGKSYAVSLEDAIAAMPGTLEGNAEYLKLLQDMAKAGQVAGGTVAHISDLMRDQAIDAQIAAGAYADVADSYDRAARATGGYSVSLEDALAQIPGTVEGNEAYLRVLNDLAAAGQIGASFIDAVTEAMKRQAEQAAIDESLREFGGIATDVNTGETVYQTEEEIRNAGANVEGLTGTYFDLASAIENVGEFSRDELQDLIRLSKLGADAALELWAAWNEKNPLDFAAQLDAIAGAQALGDRLESAVDPVQIQAITGEIADYLASDVGKLLPDGVKQGLEDGIADAQAFVELASNIGDAVQDGVSRTLNVPAAPDNEFTKWADTIFGLGSEGLSDPTTLNALTESLDTARKAGRLTEDDLQNLLNLIREFGTEPDIKLSEKLDLKDMQDGIKQLTEDFDSGKITAPEFVQGLQQAGTELEGFAQAAREAGNPVLARQFDELADSLRAMNPAIAGALQAIGKFQEYAGYVQQLAGAFAALDDGTSGTDIIANITGIGNAAGKLVDLATDVGKILLNPADIGAWVGAITKVASSVADAIGGFKKAQAEVKKLKEDFQKDNPLLNGGDYQKTFTRSRGFFADVFGGGPEVVNQIDELGLTFAKTMAGAFTDGIKGGLKEAVMSNDFSKFKGTLRESVFAGMLDGVIDLFFNQAIMKEIIAPAIKAWSDALQTPGTADDDAALDGLDNAIDRVGGMADRFEQDVNPMLQRIKERYGIQGPQDVRGVDTSSLSTMPEPIQFALATPLLDGVRGLKEAADRQVSAATTMEGAAASIKETFGRGFDLRGPQGTGYVSTTGAL